MAYSFLKKIISILLILSIFSCTNYTIKRKVSKIHEVKGTEEHDYLKVFMKNSEIYVLTKWSLDAESEKIVGEGRHLSSKLEIIKRGKFSLNYDEINFLEINDIDKNADFKAYSGIMVAGIVAAGFALYCLSNEKACFGSCPTIYFQEDKNGF